jgi:hypothetical protein
MIVTVTRVSAAFSQMPRHSRAKRGASSAFSRPRQLFEGVMSVSRRR